jgi:transcriptional regulator with XRE-family HTH domain
MLSSWFRCSHGPPKVFATNLRRLWHARGLSQDDLAYEAEVSRSYLSQLEQGEHYASLKIIGKLADVLRAEPAEFLKLPLSAACAGEQRAARLRQLH